MSTLTEGKTNNNNTKWQATIRKVLLAIDAARYTAYNWSTAGYYPESLSSIKKYFGIHT